MARSSLKGLVVAVGHGSSFLFNMLITTFFTVSISSDLLTAINKVIAASASLW